jgi:hypothetical protein
LGAGRTEIILKVNNCTGFYPKLPVFWNGLPCRIAFAPRGKCLLDIPHVERDGFRRAVTSRLPAHLFEFFDAVFLQIAQECLR